MATRRKSTRKKSRKSSSPKKPRKSRTVGASEAAALAASSTIFTDSPVPPPAPAPDQPRPALPSPAPRAGQPRAPRHAAPSVHGVMSSKPRPAPPARPAPAPRGAPSATPDKLSMAQIYETLAALLVPYARKMESEMHPKIGFCLKSRSPKTGREVHFGAVQAQPDGVAYHLFPLYAHPELLENISPDLYQRMRGQTCFHFEDLHAGLVAELAELTHAGFERFLADGQV